MDNWKSIPSILLVRWVAVIMKKKKAKKGLEKSCMHNEFSAQWCSNATGLWSLSLWLLGAQYTSSHAEQRLDITHTAGTASDKGETGWRKGIRIFTPRKCSRLNTITAALACWEEEVFRPPVPDRQCNWAQRSEVSTSESWVLCRRRRVIPLSCHWAGFRSTTEAPKRKKIWISQ